MRNSIRDELKDRFRNILSNYYKIDILEVDSDLVGCLADVAFEFFNISLDEQDKPFYDTVELTLKDYLGGNQ